MIKLPTLHSTHSSQLYFNVIQLFQYHTIVDCCHLLDTNKTYYCHRQKVCNHWPSQMGLQASYDTHSLNALNFTKNIIQSANSYTHWHLTSALIMCHIHKLHCVELKNFQLLPLNTSYKPPHYIFTSNNFIHEYYKRRCHINHYQFHHE